MAFSSKRLQRHAMHWRWQQQDHLAGKTIYRQGRPYKQPQVDRSQLGGTVILLAILFGITIGLSISSQL